ncbi:MAG: proline iminopeptidase-family hydrolase [Elusimicrobia bacterium]|nr:proline iminopeptidase-family hydrolase [Elusimicrobiota bacterium]
MTQAAAVHEGTVTFRGYKVWYRIVGEREAPGKLPLLCLHGGPGGAHDYLEPLEAMAATGRRVIFYDQLGCGRSDQPHDPSLWTVPLFVEELAAMRRALALERVHILGQSWGGMLALEHALTKPSGLASLILADSPASMRQWASETGRLRAELPEEVRRTLSGHEAAGTTDDPAYQEAMLVFYRRHVCRLDPWPDCLNRSFAQLGRNPEVYHAMNGPSEFTVTGNFKDWDITARLGEIRVPALVLSGRHDEATPAIAGTVHRGIAGSRWVIFENSSHMPHLEETPLYLRELTGFLDAVESGLSSFDGPRVGC